MQNIFVYIINWNMIDGYNMVFIRNCLRRKLFMSRNTYHQNSFILLKAINVFLTVSTAVYTCIKKETWQRQYVANSDSAQIGGLSMKRWKIKEFKCVLIIIQTWSLTSFIIMFIYSLSPSFLKLSLKNKVFLFGLYVFIMKSLLSSQNISHKK